MSAGIINSGINNQNQYQNQYPINQIQQIPIQYQQIPIQNSIQYPINQYQNPDNQIIPNNSISKKNEIINKIEFHNYKYDYKFFINCLIQIFFFIIMLIILIEFYFIDKIKVKITNDIIDNINFYINNLDLNKDNISNKYFKIDKIKKFEYEKMIELINNNDLIMIELNQNFNYVYLILSYILIIFSFIIMYILFFKKITIKDFFFLIVQNIFIFIIIGLFQYYFLEVIINNYSFVNGTNFSDNLINIIKSYKLI